MREIRFRAIHKLTKHWFEDIHIIYQDGEWFEDYRALEDGRPMNLEQVAIMQYTGLKDKNGVEIYEGDIVENASKDLKFQVVYEAPSFNRKWIDDTSKRYRELLTEPLAWNTYMICEVIGNIYENPELLEDK